VAFHCRACGTEREALAGRRSAAALDGDGLAGSGEKFLRVKGYRELKEISRKLNPSSTEQGDVQLTQQEQVA
jgi:hypothetical protein